MISAIFLFLNFRFSKLIKMFLKKLFSFWNAGDMIPMSTVPNTFGAWQWSEWEHLFNTKANSLNFLLTLSFGSRLEPLVYVAFLDESIENIEHTVATSCLDSTFRAKHGWLVVGFGGRLRAEQGKGLELVYKLVNDVPQPLCREWEGNWSAIRI